MGLAWGGARGGVGVAALCGDHKRKYICHFHARVQLHLHKHFFLKVRLADKQERLLPLCFKRKPASR